jgi:hypothetical protein
MTNFFPSSRDMLCGGCLNLGKYIQVKPGHFDTQEFLLFLAFFLFVAPKTHGSKDLLGLRIRHCRLDNNRQATREIPTPLFAAIVRLFLVSRVAWLPYSIDIHSSGRMHITGPVSWDHRAHVRSLLGLSWADVRVTETAMVARHTPHGPCRVAAVAAVAAGHFFFPALVVPFFFFLLGFFYLLLYINDQTWRQMPF